MIDNSNRIRTRLPSGFVLEVTPNSSGQHPLVAASPADQNLYQNFVFTEVPGGQESYTIENTAATGTYSVFLELTRLSMYTPLTVTASPRSFDNRSQEWELTVAENVNNWLVHCDFFTVVLIMILTLSPPLSDYYVIQSVHYPGVVLDLDQMGVVNASSQSPQQAVNQQWALIPVDGPPDSTDLQDLKDQVAELEEQIADLKEQIEEKDSVIKDKDKEIKQLTEGAVVDGYDAAGWKDKYLSSESTAERNIKTILIAVRGTISVQTLVRYLFLDDVQRAAIDMLATITDTKIPAEMHAALKSDAIPALVSLITPGNPNFRGDATALQRSCKALRNICFWADGRVDALDAGAIPPLIQLLSHDSSQVQSAAADALGCVCNHDPARVIAISLKAIPVIVRLIASTDNNVYAAAAFALAELNRYTSDGPKASIEANALPPLVRLLSSSDNKVLQNSCEALCNICHSEDYTQAAALSAGSIPPLIHLLWHDDYNVQFEAAYALAHICLYGPAQITALNSNAIPALIPLFTSTYSNARAFALFAFANVNILSDANIVSVKANAIPPLVKLLSSSENWDLAYACKALRNICVRERDAQAAAFSAGAIPPLIRLFPWDNISVKSAAVEAFANICLYGPARVGALNSNAIPALVRLLPSQDDRVRGSAALALANINILSDANVVSAEANAIPPLVQLLSFNSDTTLQWACKALTNICDSNNDARAAALSTGAVQPLTRLISNNNRDVKVRSSAAEALEKIRQR